MPRKATKVKDKPLTSLLGMYVMNESKTHRNSTFNHDVRKLSNTSIFHTATVSMYDNT